MKLPRNHKRPLLLGLGLLAVVLCLAGAVYARNKIVWVSTRTAKLREGPGAGEAKAVAYVPCGEQLEVLEENEKYYKVLWHDDEAGADFTGWVSKKQVSDERPRGEYQGRSRANLTKLTGSKAGATAGTRGLNEAQKYAKAKNLEEQLKFVTWMETLAPLPEALDSFMEQGSLGPYSEE
ncbi:MAG: SH3 domain-containing protein [Planctomycetes bacterium]|nr:SH3 domain-containing protein [Planctomycetota bacterium]